MLVVEYMRIVDGMREMRWEMVWTTSNVGEGQLDNVNNEGKEGKVKIWKMWALWKIVGEVSRDTILGNVHNNYFPIVIDTY